MSELPSSWAMVRLGEIGTVGSSRRVRQEDWQATGVPFYRAREIAVLSREGSVENELFISRELFKRLASEGLIPEAGDLMITGVGTIGVPYVVKETDEFYFKDASVLIFKNRHRIVPEYLFYFFTSEGCRRQIHAGSKCTTVDTFTIIRANELPIPLPPLPEQKRIVAKIEELFSELEAGEESLRVARRQLGVYRQSLLKQAFEGKLTAPWRAQNPDKLESPASLLARIQSARQARYEEELKDWARELKQWEKSSQAEKRPSKPRRPQDVQFPTSDQIENLSELPTSWAWISVANCAVEISDGPFGSNLKSDDYVGSGVRVVRLENIGAGEFIEDKESFISPEKYQKLKRHTVRPGDIVVASFINDAVRAALIPPSIEYAVNKADCFQVHCFGDTISSDYMVRCFGARYFFKQLEQLVHGVGRPRINTTQLGEAFVPLCSLPEQQEIVRLLDEQFEVIERNEREIDAALKRSEALRQAILHRAFTGRLVPQDPADEPASALLGRLLAERTHVPASSHKRALAQVNSRFKQ